MMFPLPSPSPLPSPLWGYSYNNETFILFQVVRGRVLADGTSLEYRLNGKSVNAWLSLHAIDIFLWGHKF